MDIAGQVGEHLQLSLGYTNLRFQTSENDWLVADFTPKRLLRLAAVYELPWLPSLREGGTMRWQNDISREQGSVAADAPNGGRTIVTRQDAYALIGLLASYDFSPQLRASLNVENITDEKYISSLYWSQGFYGRARHASLSLTWSL